MGTTASSPEAASEGGRFAYIPGLRNEGNTCFANAVLQALSSIPQFHAYLERIIIAFGQKAPPKAVDDVCRALGGASAQTLQESRDRLIAPVSHETLLHGKLKPGDAKTRAELARRLLTLLQQLSRGMSTPSAPLDSRVLLDDFVAMFRRHGESGPAGEQQDAHEMFLLLESSLARDADDNDPALSAPPKRDFFSAHEALHSPQKPVLMATPSGGIVDPLEEHLASPLRSISETTAPAPLAVVPVRHSPLVKHKHRSRVPSGVLDTILDDGSPSHVTGSDHSSTAVESHATESNTEAASSMSASLLSVSPVRLALAFSALDVATVRHVLSISQTLDEANRNAALEIIRSASRRGCGLPVTPLLVTPSSLNAVFDPKRPVLRSPFRGSTATSVLCESCRTASEWSPQPFTCLSLPIAGSSVQSCLRAQLRDERITDGYKCDRCGNRGSAIKRTRLIRPPPIFCLHLQRQCVGVFGPSKNSAHVRFNARFDATPLCAHVRHPEEDDFALPVETDAIPATVGAAASSKTVDSRKPTAAVSYALASVVVHLGGAFGGHYISFRRVPQMRQDDAGDGAPKYPGDGDWVCASDELVRPTKLKDVKAAEAYMLFYVRCDAHADPDSGAEHAPRSEGLGYWDVSGGGHKLVYTMCYR
jgi:ubiquitin C-terminal hydrolase